MTTLTHAVVQLQITREENMLSLGRDRALAKDLLAAAKGKETRTERYTLEHLVPVAAGFLRDLLDATRNTTGARPVWHATLSSLDLDEAAASALRVAFQGGMRSHPLSKVQLAAGRAMESLVIHTGLRATAVTKAQKRTLRSLEGQKMSPANRQRHLRAAAEEAGGMWDEETLALMGIPLINAALSTGLFERTLKTRGRITTDAFSMSAEGLQACREVSELASLARPVWRPMLAPPKPWVALRGGAYMTEAVSAHLTMVRTYEGTHKGLLARALKDRSLAPVQKALDIIQSVPLRINVDVQVLRDYLWQQGIAVECAFPLRTPVVVPEKVSDEDAQGLPERHLRRLRAGRARALRVNAGIGPNILAFESVSAEAAELAQSPQFYLPASLDFRGRVNPIPFLNHHATDATKALFEFATGHPVGPDGLRWLQIHTANCGDYGKISKQPYDERVTWCQDNMDLIVATATDPLEDTRWHLADAPFSFYAACLDLYRALSQPTEEETMGYVSHLPVALDGSNSGVQHYSALMRAEEAQHVNLTPEGKPQDLYTVVAQGVADRCLRLSRMAAQAVTASLGYTPTTDDAMAFYDALTASIEGLSTDADGEQLRLDPTQTRSVAKLKRRRALMSAILWNAFGVTRSTVKRGGMTYVYSSRAFGMSQQVFEDTMEPLALKVLQRHNEYPIHPFGADEGKAASIFMGSCIYRSVVSKLPRAAAAMAWLRAVAAVLAHEQKGVLLVTPLGFPMLMRTTEPTSKRFCTLLLDRSLNARVVDREALDGIVVGDSVLKRVRCTVRTGNDVKVLKDKQQSGVAPNVIHSMDACHLHATVLACAERGLTDLLLIHDSFASHAGKAGGLSVILREQMVGLYETYCPLKDIDTRARGVLSEEGQAKLPPLPEKGPLDLGVILKAEYAFS